MPKRTNDGVRKRCGCSRRQWPKCAHPWHFSFHHGGHEYRYSLDTIARARNERPPTTKGEAVSWRDRLRGEIRTGTFVDPDAPVPAASVATDGIETRLTFGDTCDVYVKEHVRTPARRPRAAEEMAYQVTALRRIEVPASGGAIGAFGEEADRPHHESRHRGVACRASSGDRAGPYGLDGL
jgi:hypothetical protein